MRLIQPSEVFEGDRVVLRLLTVADCSDRYVGWLNDPEVARYLETRWSPQDLGSVRSFVASMVDAADSYLFAILSKVDGAHVGNIKIGPVRRHHDYADVSFFIGERSVWGRGLASDAIRVATGVGFARLELHRLQAGLYENNAGSARALEKAGYRFEARLRKQLRSDAGWEDHLWYGVLREEWSVT